MSAFRILLAVLGGCVGWLGAQAAIGPNPRPNIVMISLDDQNDWIGALGSNPDVRTPNIDRLAQRGALFLDAHSPATVCGPARNTVLTGYAPYTTGIYNNFDQPMRSAARLRHALTLGQQFKAAGYHSAMRGKVLNLTDLDPDSWSSFWPELKKRDKTPPAERRPEPPLAANAVFAEDGAQLTAERLVQMRDTHTAPRLSEPQTRHRDYQTATRTIQFLEEKRDEPFFLCVGFTGTHWGWEAPAEYYRMYPKDKLTLPPRRPDGRETGGLPAAVVNKGGLAATIVEQDLLRQGLQTYLAAISFQDAQVGRVLDALARSPHAATTLVILWSDQGFHLGEKNHWGKSTLWRQTSRVPLIISGPGIPAGPRRQCVGLVDLYPTLVDLCGLKPVRDVDGRSLRPLLASPDASWDVPVVTSRSPERLAVRTSEWCYIRHVTREGVAEELYARTKDPHEWENLAHVPALADIKRRMLALLPAKPTPHLVDPASVGREDVDL